MAFANWTTTISAMGIGAVVGASSGCVDVPHRRHGDGAADARAVDDALALDAREADAVGADTGALALDEPEADALSGDTREPPAQDADTRDASDASDTNRGDACAADARDCNGSCVDLSNNLMHCGACGHACSATNHRAPSCERGACVVGGCERGYGDCDGLSINGCETAINTPFNCGTCGRRGVSETCNGVDDNCNGVTDENCPVSVQVNLRAPALPTALVPQSTLWSAAAGEARSIADVFCPGGYVLRGVFVARSAARSDLLGTVRLRCAEVLVSGPRPFTARLGPDENGDGRPTPAGGWDTWSREGTGGVCPDGQVVTAIDSWWKNSAGSSTGEGLVQLGVRCGTLTIDPMTDAVRVEPSTTPVSWTSVPARTSQSYSVTGGYCGGGPLTGIHLDFVTPTAAVIQFAEYCSNISIMFP